MAQHVYKDSACQASGLWCCAWLAGPQNGAVEVEQVMVFNNGWAMVRPHLLSIPVQRFSLVFLLVQLNALEIYPSDH